MYTKKHLREIIKKYTNLYTLNNDNDIYYRKKNNNDWVSIQFLPDDINKCRQFGPKEKCFDGNHVVIGNYYDGQPLSIYNCIDSIIKYLKSEDYYHEYFLKQEFDNWFKDDFVFVDRPTIKPHVAGKKWEKILINNFVHEQNKYYNGYVLYANLDGSLKCVFQDQKYKYDTFSCDFSYELIEKNYNKHEIIEPNNERTYRRSRTSEELTEYVQLLNEERTADYAHLWNRPGRTRRHFPD